MVPRRNVNNFASFDIKRLVDRQTRLHRHLGAYLNR
jgi:hypothetical protein